MAESNRPGAHHSDRAGEFVFRQTLPHTTALPQMQRHHHRRCQLVGWAVDRWLGVSRVEVHHGR